MIISTAMSPRNKDLNEETIEPEVLGPSDEEIAEIGPPPEVSHRIAKEDLHTADSTAVVPVTALQQYLAEVRLDRKSTRLNSSHLARSRMPSSA